MIQYSSGPQLFWLGGLAEAAAWGGGEEGKISPAHDFHKCNFPCMCVHSHNTSTVFNSCDLALGSGLGVGDLCTIILMKLVREG